MPEQNEEALLAFQRLDVYRVARELAMRVHAAKIRDAELRDQAGRASKSCFLNIAEGLPSESPAMRKKFFACAEGSLCETVAAIDLAEALESVAPSDAQRIHSLAVRVKHMLRAMR